MSSARRIGALLVAATLLGACAAPRQQVSDPPYVEQLRLRITKVRGAIQETREAIARSRGAAWLPELYVRLAELLSEEARYHFEVAYEREQRSSRVLHVPQVRFLKEQAISVYRRVLAEHPDAALADRILFNIGHELRELGRYDEMVAALEELSTRFPKSPLRAEALLVLGDHAFDKGELETAERRYQAIVSGPPTAVTGLAHYKLGWVWMNRADCAKSLGAFERAIDAAAAWQAARGASGTERAGQGGVGVGGAAAERPGQAIDVRREALVDLVYCYATDRPVAEALPYLRSRAATRAAYVAALERLASRYGVLDEAKGSAAVTRELLRLGPTAPERLDDARQLYGAVTKAGLYDRVGEDVGLITTALRRQLQRVEGSEEMRQLTRKELELYARDLATRAQAAFQRRPQDTALGAQVAKAYAVWLDAFPQAGERVAILLNLADVLAELGRHEEAGLRYAEAAQVSVDDASRKDRLYDAVVEFQASLGGLAGRSHTDRVVVRAAMRRSGEQLLAMGLEPDKARVTKLGMAQTWYDSGDYDRAIDQLTALAYEYPGTKEGRAAVHLVLDSFNTLNDYEGLIAAGRRFMGPGGPADDALRREILPIVTAAENRRLDEVSLAAAGAEGGDLDSLEQFAERYQGTDLGERALLNAFVAARAVGDRKRLYELGEELARSYPKSEQVPGILGSLGKQAVATFELDRAVGLFEKAAAGATEQRPRLLVAAGELLEATGQTQRALDLYGRAVAAAGETAARQQPLERLARALEILGDDRRLVSTLAPLSGGASADVLARLGLAQARIGRVDDAERNLGAALAAPDATAEAKARAHLGSAETLARALEGYEVAGDLEGIQELVTLIDVTEQAYLQAARQGSALVTPVALGRLAAMAGTAAARVSRLQPPGDLSAADAEAFRQGLARRVDALGATGRDALQACAEQAWTGRVFNEAVRSCLAGRPVSADAVRAEGLRPRASVTLPPAAEELRGRLAKNPEDAETLVALASLALDAGDPHLARVALARAVAQGGGPEAQNLLGIASLDAGDLTGALEAFADAADAGLEAGRQNLAAALRGAGLAEAAQKALERFAAGKPGGRLLPGAGGS
ncbi:MAG: tetratricopeptide repeat protein [Deltaproteobacteria bacterium]|nr:tetratricopeptide repeat protein [Deltaproteobacteria bacterium]MCB9786077.1 tetratricopeptide repeat protein [Deltaproteobacteria bacterium]